MVTHHFADGALAAKQIAVLGIDIDVRGGNRVGNALVGLAVADQGDVAEAGQVAGGVVGNELLGVFPRLAVGVDDSGQHADGGGEGVLIGVVAGHGAGGVGDHDYTFAMTTRAGWLLYLPCRSA